MGQRSGHAFGHPGLAPTWQTAQKLGLGTALGNRSQVWFTLARGIVTEVYYPRVDVANVRDLQLLVSDGQTFVHEEQRDLRHDVKPLDPGVPAYRLLSTDPQGRYRLSKRIITDPDVDALIMEVTFEALHGRLGDYSLYLLLNPRAKNNGLHNFARVKEIGERKVLLAWRDDVLMAAFASRPGGSAWRRSGPVVNHEAFGLTQTG